ncbi:hypothetical protein [Acidithiobacillus caldus]|uniref:Uncharacterized protein n=1 Tax=Acidithiobacillus caldus TaxID=33059 RepID=A0A1E7YPN0_9PROT|nr:hypothetical protein [Acidithiobacillus caldus]OFC37639.1 hypothetical protein BAE29_10360 [Acidithiobacillus caldus]OFC37745.1 hypothetical protein BAE28_06720 [Acidithiobacillus caldus]OFC37909.1 hypothetical protein BAE27_03290 [Acidithiobacillus caldus]
MQALSGIQPGFHGGNFARNVWKHFRYSVAFAFSCLGFVLFAGLSSTGGAESLGRILVFHANAARDVRFGLLFFFLVPFSLLVSFEMVGRAAQAVAKTTLYQRLAGVVAVVAERFEAWWNRHPLRAVFVLIGCVAGLVMVTAGNGPADVPPPPTYPASDLSHAHPVDRVLLNFGRGSGNIVGEAHITNLGDGRYLVQMRANGARKEN